jgi:hypothetical protein
MSSPSGLNKANWSGTPAGWLFKAIILIYYKKGQRGKTIADSFRSHVSRDIYVPIIGVDVTDNAIEQRGHKGVLPSNAFEHPDKHPMGMKMMPYAINIVENKKILTKEDIDTIVKTALSSQEEIKVEQTTVNEEKKQGGYFYVLGTGSTRCGVGHTFQQDYTKRTNSFKKGDLDDNMEVKYVMWLEKPQVLELEVKNALKMYALGSEKFEVHADHAIHTARFIADAQQIAYYNVKKPREGWL